MPRRELFTATERAELIAFPPDEGDLIRLATLSRSDLAYIRQHRGDHNRLGLSVLMVYLRFPSRVLAPGAALRAAGRYHRRTAQRLARGLGSVCHAR